MTGAAVQNSAALQDGRVRYGAPPFLRFACDAECRIGLRLAKVDEHSHCPPAQAGVQPLEVLDFRFRGNDCGTGCTTERSEESFPVFFWAISRRGD
jgi:hypothetical protein